MHDCREPSSRAVQVPVLSFFNPTMVITSGLLFIVIANLIAEDGPSLEVTVFAAIPVALW